MSESQQLLNNLPPNYDTFTPEQKVNVLKYLQTLSPIQLQAYYIAIDHLQTSYDILRSNGYNNWLKEQGKTEGK